MVVHDSSPIASYVGRECGYCHDPIKANDVIRVCVFDDLPHHEECCGDGRGCANVCSGELRRIGVGHLPEGKPAPRLTNVVYSHIEPSNSINQRRQNTHSNYVKFVLIGGLSVVIALGVYFLHSGDDNIRPGRTSTSIIYQQTHASKPEPIRTRTQKDKQENQPEGKFKEPAESFYRTAKTQLEKGNYYLARKHIKSALSRDHHNPKYNILKAEIEISYKAKGFKRKIKDALQKLDR